MTNWDNNYIQFARLLAEIYSAAGLTTEQYEQLKASMDLGYEDIDEIFERAMLEFERVKIGKLVRKVTPQKELEEALEAATAEHLPAAAQDIMDEDNERNAESAARLDRKAKERQL